MFSNQRDFTTPIEDISPKQLDNFVNATAFPTTKQLNCKADNTWKTFRDTNMTRMLGWRYISSLHSASEPQEGRNNCPLLRSYFIGSCHVGVSKRFSRSISLAVYCLSSLSRPVQGYSTIIPLFPFSFFTINLLIRFISCWMLHGRPRYSRCKIERYTVNINIVHSFPGSATFYRLAAWPRPGGYSLIWAI